ncbi:MAG TPA: anti-sigma factor [Acidimicrobiales bacterium]|nr:anti-sigma factor [Acidimicrobiales bacterium]
MTSDDDRVEYLAGGPATGPGDPELDEVRALLADPALWADPAPELEDSIVAAIAGEAATGAGPDRATGSSRHRGRRGRSLLLAGIGTAAAVLLAVVVAVGAGSGDDDPDLRLALRATELAPGAGGAAELTKTPSGWRIDLATTGLPRLDDGELYQAWLRDDDGTLVAIGTFNGGEDVVLWAGVSPVDYPTLTVTREEVDGDPGSSGAQVLVGRAEPR